VAERRAFGRLRRKGETGTPGSGAGDGVAASPACRYVAIIMDGNGRWAQRRHLPVAAGHRAGAKALRAVIERALDVGVKELSVFSFSTENWRRPAAEVAALMDLFVEMIEKEIPDLHKENARVRFLGRREGVPPKLVQRIEAAEALTAGDTRMTVFIAFNYGGRAEILDAARAYAAAMTAASVEAPGRPAAGAGDEVQDDSFLARPELEGEGSEVFRPFLYAPEMHDPELLIRTSGEMRISNFLLWQLAYAELYFTPTLWPDFGGDDLEEALAEYGRRQRRYGAR
jgi:undecaprenyl diphosphate synthase